MASHVELVVAAEETADICDGNDSSSMNVTS